jgi:hypothetical protein
MALSMDWIGADHSRSSGLAGCRCNNLDTAASAGASNTLSYPYGVLCWFAVEAPVSLDIALTWNAVPNTPGKEFRP